MCAKSASQNVFIVVAIFVMDIWSWDSRKWLLAKHAQSNRVSTKPIQKSDMTMYCAVLSAIQRRLKRLESGSNFLRAHRRKSIVWKNKHKLNPNKKQFSMSLGTCLRTAKLFKSRWRDWNYILFLESKKTILLFQCGIFRRLFFVKIFNFCCQLHAQSTPKMVRRWALQRETSNRATFWYLLFRCNFWHFSLWQHNRCQHRFQSEYW